MAVAFSWKGSVDTDLNFSEFFGQDHTVAVRFMPEYPHAYFGPVLAENGAGTFLIGQGDYNSAPGGTKFCMQIGGQAMEQFPTPVRVLPSTWQHLAITRTGTSFTLYWNGDRLGSVRQSVGGADPVGTLRLGRRSQGQAMGGQNAQFYGIVDQLVVFDRSLPTVEIAALSRKFARLNGTEPGLIAGWDFLASSAGNLPAKLARPIRALGAVSMVTVSANWDHVQDSKLFQLPIKQQTMLLPFSPGEEWEVIQGFDARGGTHTGYAAFCWDFVLAGKPQNADFPAGTKGAPVFACAPGKVVRVKQDTPPPTSGSGGNVNFVQVEQSAEELAGYLHVLKDSSRVTIGDSVGRRQRVASAGGDGATFTFSHLHLAVTNAPEGTPNVVTFPVAMSDYEVRMPDGSWQYIARGIPENGQTVRGTEPRLPAPAAGPLVAYVTDFAPPGPTARVVYAGTDGHVHELYYVASVGTWGAADLSAVTGAAPAAGPLVAYVTDFSPPGPTARVVYAGTDGHVHELYYVASVGTWGAADLSAVTGAAPAAGPLVAYVTDFSPPGPTARVVYAGTDGHVHELYYVASVGTWGAADLSAVTGAAPAAGPLVAYVTDFSPPGPTARVVYAGADGHVHELYYVASVGTWGAADLT